MIYIKLKLNIYNIVFATEFIKLVTSEADQNLVRDSNKNEDFEEIRIENKCRLFGGNAIDLNAYIEPGLGEEVDGLVFGWAYFNKKD